MRFRKFECWKGIKQSVWEKFAESYEIGQFFGQTAHHASKVCTESAYIAHTLSQWDWRGNIWPDWFVARDHEMMGAIFAKLYFETACTVAVNYLIVFGTCLYIATCTGRRNTFISNNCMCRLNVYPHIMILLKTIYLVFLKNNVFIFDLKLIFSWLIFLDF